MSRITCFGVTGAIVAIQGERVTVEWPANPPLLPAQTHTYLLSGIARMAGPDDEAGS